MGSIRSNDARNPCEMIYLDNNGTTMVDDQVIQAMKNHFDQSNLYGNPSSTHSLGKNARQLIDQCRDMIRKSINAKFNEEILFTSGGTESNNFALEGILTMNKDEIQHVITTPFEHPSVENVLLHLRTIHPRIEISSVHVDHQGLIDLDHFQQLLRPTTKFVSVMHSNNEIGTIQPIKDIVQICRSYGESQIVIHSDASQSMGKVSIDVQDLGIDLLTICSHKYHGPKGIAVLYIRQGIHLNPLMFGGNHEYGKRPGTENIWGIVGLAKASEPLCDPFILQQRIEQMRKTRDRLYHGLSKRFQDHPFIQWRRNGSDQPSSSLPNTLNLSFTQINGKQLIETLQDRLAFSTGSACHQSSSSSLSSTLKAIGLPKEFANGTLRLTTSYMTTFEEIDQAIELLSDAIEQQISSSKSF